jgi:hypothetical protein
MGKEAMANESQGRSKPNPEAYNRLVAYAKIQAIRLVGTRFDIKPETLSTARDDLEYQISNQLIDWCCDNEAQVLNGTWEYTASCVVGRKKLLTITAKYLVTYRLSAICDEEAGHQFLERVGKFAAYPYFRGTFALLTQQSGVMLHPLPVISDQPRWVTPPEQIENTSPVQTDKKPKRSSRVAAAAKESKK